MNTLSKSLSILALASSLLLSPNLYAASYHPEALEAVKAQAEAVLNNGQTPVAIFDLDDTLINTRERTLRIIQKFIAKNDVKARFQEETQKLSELKTKEVHFLLVDTMNEKAVTNPAFVKETSDFWLSAFFTNEYSANDTQTTGAVAYVRSLYAAGVKIVYLTGRDAPRMQKGAIENLQKLGFPLDGVQAILMMKPDQTASDLEFKISMFPTIAKMGVVVGVFENEPANVNAHHDAFPDAVAVFLDTIHSPKPDVPEAGIFFVQDFNL